MGSGDYIGLFSLYSLKKFRYREINSRRILMYILPVRFRALLFLWMSSYTWAGVILHLIYGCWICLSAGLLLALAVLRQGNSGIVMFGGCLLPQWLFYAEMWKTELHELQRLMFRGKILTETEGGRERWKIPAFNLAKMIILCVCGCVTEAYAGMWSIKFFLKLFS